MHLVRPVHREVPGLLHHSLELQAPAHPYPALMVPQALVLTDPALPDLARQSIMNLPFSRTLTNPVPAELIFKIVTFSDATRIADGVNTPHTSYTWHIHSDILMRKKTDNIKYYMTAFYTFPSAARWSSLINIHTFCSWYMKDIKWYWIYTITKIVHRLILFKCVFYLKILFAHGRLKTMAKEWRLYILLFSCTCDVIKTWNSVECCANSLYFMCGRHF